ncbi:MAG: type II secretion system protein GspF [Deltaproteobacteria bacterium]|nr:type II secretion system protein GspF [Deltaproteobacteria bacterium]
MPVYAYRGLSEGGRQVRGVVDAESARGARTRLRRDGIYPTEVVEESARPSEGASRLFQRGTRVRNADLATLSRQLATLIAAGVPVVEALGAVSEQSESPTVTRVLSHLRDDVSQGTSLADSMSEHPGVFPELYVGMVRAGEAAGALDLVLERLATHTEAQTRLQARVRTALAYPLFMSLFSGAIVVFLLAFVVPKVTRIFSEQKQELPLPTRILLGLSNAITDNFLLLLIVLVLLVAGALAMLRRPGGRAWLDRRLLDVPFVGPILTKIAVARFARTLATLLANGIPLLTALDLARRVTGNVAMSDAVEEARAAIREGQGVAAPLRKTGLFPPLLTHMIAVGERSGELEPMLARVADAYEQEVESALGGLTAIFEPLMIVVMGGVMLFIVLAILLPIFEINSLVR